LNFSAQICNLPHTWIHLQIYDDVVLKLAVAAAVAAPTNQFFTMCKSAKEAEDNMGHI
jgi:hypothetical protein